MQPSPGLDRLYELLPLLLPILLIQLGLMVYCLVDLSRREQTRGPKWLWAVLIILGQLWGPIAYLFIGREE